MQESISLWIISAFALLWAFIALGETYLNLKDQDSLWTTFDIVNMSASGFWALAIFVVTLIGGFAARK